MNIVYLFLAVLALIAFGIAMLQPRGDADRRIGFVAIGLFLTTAILVLSYGDRVF